MKIFEIKNGVVTATDVEKVTFEKHVDVLVSGLGTAGSLAALYAAENGLSVLGVESYNCIGGTNTIGGISWHYFGYPGGRHMDTDEKVNDFNEQFGCVHTESRKLVVEAELLDKGVEILYEASICGVYKEKDTVVGVKVFTADGFINIGCKVLMDCTGDAVTAHMAGCESEYGRTWDGQAQPYSMVSLMYDETRYRFTNIDFGRVDQRDDEALSEAYIFSRALEMSEERKDMRFVAHMPLIGVREGRRILSEEQITVVDLFSDKQTKTPVYYAYADLDKHGWDIAFDGDALCDWAVGANLGAYNVTVPISFKTIIPKGVNGLLVPCRALGVDRDIASCVRMLPDMKKLAEVAADMAFLAIRENCALKEIPYEELRDRLIKSGCLNHADNRGVRVDGAKDANGDKLPVIDVTFVTEPEKLEATLATDKPGEAIWAAKQMGEKAVPILKKLLESEDENTRKHASFALASIGDASCLPILRDMVSMRDDTMLKDCRKNNNQRGYMAIYWLGRLGDAEIVDTLIQMICDENEIKNPVYHSDKLTTRYAISAFNGVYFQFITNAVAALLRIGNANENLRSKIEEAFKTAFSDDSYYKRITTRPKKSSEGNMVQCIRNIAFSAIENWNK
ncbi:MAG: FAD-dependent oxidoreductase [Clostridia bacterium]|nr:FAD-dependent oxidoreductase [Clostridia bacterium]